MSEFEQMMDGMIATLQELRESIQICHFEHLERIEILKSAIEHSE